MLHIPSCPAATLLCGQLCHHRAQAQELSSRHSSPAYTVITFILLHLQIQALTIDQRGHRT